MIKSQGPIDVAEVGMPHPGGGGGIARQAMSSRTWGTRGKTFIGGGVKLSMNYVQANYRGKLESVKTYSDKGYR